MMIKKQHSSENSNHTKKNLYYCLGCVGIIAVAIAIFLAVFYTRDDDDKFVIDKPWVETFAGTYAHDDTSASQPDMRVHQLKLTQENGTRLFVSKKQSAFDTHLIQIFDYNETSHGWFMDSELRTGQDILQQEIEFMIPSQNGNRLAISDSENVTIYQQQREDNNHTSSWVQVGDTLTTDVLTDILDPASVYSFGRHAMELSEDGTLLTLAASLSEDSYNGTLVENEPYAVLSFREENNVWQLLDFQKDFLTNVLSDSQPVLASSGDAVAFPQAIDREQEWKTAVSIYGYTPAEAWTQKTLLVGPGLHLSFFGLDFRSIGFSYNGDTCAIADPNFESPDNRHGRVEVYQWADDGDKRGYVIKGQVLEPSPDTYQFGKLVSLSNNGDRLAVSYSDEDGQVYVQVYVYDPDTTKWNLFGNPISESVRDVAEYLSLSEDGSRVAIAWDCTPKELYCLSVYE